MEPKTEHKEGPDLALMVHHPHTTDDTQAIELLEGFNGRVVVIPQHPGEKQVLPSLRVEHLYFRGLAQIRSYVELAKKSDQPAKAY